LGQFHWDPTTYCERVHAEVPGYERFEETVAAATVGTGADPVLRVLDLGTGTGETARRVLDVHPAASLVGVDASARMLDGARRALPAARVELHVRRLEDALPDGPFDLVISALAVHHLVADGKRSLFRRVLEVLRPGGRFVLGDVVTTDEGTGTTPVDHDHDRPDSVDDQLAWLAEAGFAADVVWSSGDLAVLVGDRPVRP
jgi:tRNA (cmo5U34)-methyltransferase